MLSSVMSDDESVDLQTRKAIVIGSVGSGKTSLCRYVTGLYDANTDSKMSGHSITKGVRLYKGRYLKVNKAENTKIQFVMTDSEGYGADNFSSDNLKNQLVTSLMFETELHCVIIVVSFERFRNGLKEDLDHLLCNIKTLGLAKEHTLVCFTHCEMYTDAVKNSYFEEFKKYYGFDIDKSNVVFGCFPNTSEINEQYGPLIVEDVKRSIADVRQKLQTKNIAVNVAMKIAEIEK
jgi:GTPase SAR1 family protein